jgi:large subunit ribosomal protein L20
MRHILTKKSPKRKRQLGRQKQVADRTFRSAPAAAVRLRETKQARVKRGVTARARHRKVLDQAKGYYNARRKVYRAAKQAVIKAGQYASAIGACAASSARLITRIVAAARANGLSYSRLINGLSLA